ncbi:hypothetical protein OC845_000792 [Tilletia horrida]|nr:hypothetical protein OC845_000792 [Tilletia horrida]
MAVQNPALYTGALPKDLRNPYADITNPARTPPHHQPLGQIQSHQGAHPISHMPSSSSVSASTSTVSSPSNAAYMTSSFPYPRSTASGTIHSSPTVAGTFTSKGGPNTPAPFSVQVFAQAFDERGWPIFAGRAANITANVNLNPSIKADIEVTTKAYTTAGSSAAVWDGVILLPSANSSDRSIFTVTDHFETSSGRLTVRSPKQGVTPAQEDYILTVPLSWNLPIGASKAVVDGQAQTVPVALPPSFELTKSSDEEGSPVLPSSNSSASFYRGSPPNSSAGTTVGAPTITTATPKKSKARTVLGMVEKTLDSVTRVGCFYVMIINLIAKDTTDVVIEKAKKGSKGVTSVRGSVLDTLTIPFIFLGESTNTPLPAQALPPTLRPQLLFQSEAILAQGWQKHQISTKWTGMMLKSWKRGIDLELHLPEATAFHAPSVIPFLLVIRPGDASLLPPAPTTPPECEWQSQIGSPAGPGSVRRPQTAPTTTSNGSPSGSAFTRTTSANPAARDLARFIRICLVQVTYSTNANVNDTPLRKRSIMSVAQEVEEVELGAFLSEDASTNDEKAIAEATAAGVRVLAGKLRISPYSTPSFRSQGIEVKYAVKVDLIPFSTKTGASERASTSSGATVKAEKEKDSSSTVGSISSAMKSLRLKRSTSRFGSSYAGSIFSGKSRRARGYSDGNSEQDGWDATMSMPAGSPAQAGGGAHSGGRGAAHDPTRTQISAADSPPSTPPWTNGLHPGPSSPAAGGMPSAESASHLSSPSQLPRSISEGGAGMYRHINGGMAAAAASSGSEELNALTASNGRSRRGGPTTPTAGGARAGQPSPGPSGYGMANGPSQHRVSMSSGIEGSVNGQASDYNTSPRALGYPPSSGSPGQYAPAPALPFALNPDVAQVIAANGGNGGIGLMGGGANGNWSGGGLASPLMGVGAGRGGSGGAGSNGQPSSYAPSSWAPSNASTYGRWVTATRAPASTSSPTNLADGANEEKHILSRLSKTAGSMWVDIRVVRGIDAPVVPIPMAGVNSAWAPGMSTADSIRMSNIAAGSPEGMNGMTPMMNQTPVMHHSPQFS